MSQLAEVTGIVSSVNFRGSPNGSTFRIYCPGMKKSYNAVCNMFCPIRDGDAIYALCSLRGDVLHVEKPPFVQPCVGKENIVQCFMKALKQGYRVAVRAYDTIATIAEGDEMVIAFLTGIAQSWSDNRNSDLLFLFGDLESEDVRKLLDWWHKERNLRRLYLLGLTRKEINSCRMTCDEIYLKCMENPYTVAGIPIEKCDMILNQMNKTPNLEDRLRGTIIRLIWKNLHERGWTGTPTRYLVKNFPGIKDHVPVLKQEYGVVADLETAYLTFPHKVETWVASFFSELRRKDPIDYETPLDEKIILDNGDIVERMSAHFTTELSEDQRMAVQGALDHKVCIITGSGGTGKCLSPDTPVLMFDGSVREAQSIKKGERLMGPNNLPRAVLSTCTGVGEMFEVVPERGRSFVCNAPHVLTLRDLSANEVIDIPLQDYLLLPQETKDRFRLFHVGVEFPRKETPTDPYIMGRLLGYLSNIPEEYKINNRENRTALLRGFVQAHPFGVQGLPKRVEEGLEYIALSLGFMVSGVRDGLVFSPETNQRFTILPRGRGAYCGWQLDGDGRFLLGDFLVTHNTTCLGQVLHNLEIRGTKYAVCSFTGKAVSRIREVTMKRNPATIHRLISNARKFQSDKSQFEKDIPLTDYTHIIIDETSMVTMELIYDFLRAYPTVEKVTMFGDVNQLCPIGWGSLFQQLLKSECIPTYVLTTNYRVYVAPGERDGVILNANAIVSHDPQYPFEFVPTNNFSVIEGPIERVYDIVEACFKSGITPDQLVVICPYNASLPALNEKFQSIYDVGSKRVSDSRGIKWMVGDRVMLTENDQEIGVFNGESGTVTEVGDEEISVNFGRSGVHDFLLEPTVQHNQGYYQRTNRYTFQGTKTDDVKEIDEEEIKERTVMRLMHSYAITVDKSQGSEWDFVVFYISHFGISYRADAGSSSFLNKNRIYTAITRTKRCCWCVVSDFEAFNASACKIPAFRCDNLARRLKDSLPTLPVFKIKSPIPELEMNSELADYPEDIGDMGYDCDDFD